MDPRSEHEELRAAWRALGSVNEPTEGWRTVPLAIGGGSRLRAGRHFPGNYEALLVSFKFVTPPPDHHLPQGQGFQVSRILLDRNADHLWMALSRRPEGSPEIFTMMAGDVIAIMRSLRDSGEEHLFNTFLTRIRVWQEFMRRGGDAILDPEAEIGLFGELVFFQSLIDCGMAATAAVESWHGPLDGAQDFFICAGAVEVKTTIAKTGFPAEIGSADQLDDFMRQPLFLAAVRLALNAAGVSLATLVEAVRSRLSAHPTALNTFNLRLLQAGYLDAISEKYTRSFVHSDTRILRVDQKFPRLTKANLPAEITSVRYQIELDRIESPPISLASILTELGAI